MKAFKVNDARRACARQKPRNDLFFEHPEQFAGHAGSEKEPRLADVERKPTGGADRVVEHFGADRQHRLLAIVLRHDAVAAPEEILHAGEPFFAEHEIDAGGARCDLLRQIIDGRPKPTIDDHGVGTLPRHPECRQQFFAIVPDGRSPRHRQPIILELLGHIAEVGIDDLAGQNLVAGADDLDAHACPA